MTWLQTPQAGLQLLQTRLHTPTRQLADCYRPTCTLCKHACMLLQGNLQTATDWPPMTTDRTTDTTNRPATTANSLACSHRTTCLLLQTDLRPLQTCLHAPTGPLICCYRPTCDHGKRACMMPQGHLYAPIDRPATTANALA